MTDEFSAGATEVAVVGAGAWGTALAILAARAGRSVALWARPGETRDRLRRDRVSPHLPSHPLPDDIRLVDDLANVVAPVIVLAVPVNALVACVRVLGTGIAAGTVMVSAAKGFQAATGERGSRLIGRLAPAAVSAVLSGPTFAAEAAGGAPTAATVAAPDLDAAARVVSALSGPTFRLYTSTDVAGVEVLGAAKNVLAIACGVSDGMGLGDNARAALITRGLAEIGRLVLAEGGRPETVAGLAGVGDIVLTCTSDRSRNYRFGYALGLGTGDLNRPPSNGGAQGGDLIEGAATAAAVLRLGARHGLDTPITAAVVAVLDGEQTPRDALNALLSRPLPGTEAVDAVLGR